MYGVKIKGWYTFKQPAWSYWHLFIFKNCCSFFHVHAFNSSYDLIFSQKAVLDLNLFSNSFNQTKEQTKGRQNNPEIYFLDNTPPTLPHNFVLSALVGWTNGECTIKSCIKVIRNRFTPFKRHWNWLCCLATVLHQNPPRRSPAHPSVFLSVYPGNLEK